MKNLKITVIFLTLLILLNSCTPAYFNKQLHTGSDLEYITKQEIDSYGWEVKSVEKHENKNFLKTPFYKAWLEYDDNGMPFDRSPLNQKQMILNKIKNWHDKGKKVYVVAYVHGWHHSAFETDGNAQAFDNLMSRQVDQLRRIFEFRPDGEMPEVLGVYIGWQGESNNPYNIFTIDSRSKAADRLGNGCKNLHNENCDGASKRDFKSDLIDISQAVENSGNGKMLVIGHSLGGRALTTAFIGDFSNKSFRNPLGENTLIVTINPAVSADCYDNYFALENKDVKPSWINITSRNDIATNWIYWIAHKVGLVNACSSTSENRRNAIGHQENYITHSLDIQNYNNIVQPYPTSPEMAQNIGLPSTPTDYPPFKFASDWFVEDDISRTIAYIHRDPKVTDCIKEKCLDYRSTMFYGVKLTKKPEYNTNSRIWNISTNKNVIDTIENPGAMDGMHNGFVQTNLVRILVEMLWSENEDWKK